MSDKCLAWIDRQLRLKEPGTRSTLTVEGSNPSP